MDRKKFRNVIITVFCIAWTLLFHYESARHFYLDPFLKTTLPKVKFLFPPAGWIMFWHVDDEFSYTEVYGLLDGRPQRFDPHEIIPTRFIGFDNIKRGILGNVTYQHSRASFCRYMQRKFPEFEDFYVTVTYHPSLTRSPHKELSRVLYQCQP